MRSVILVVKIFFAFLGVAQEYFYMFLEALFVAFAGCFGWWPNGMKFWTGVRRGGVRRAGVVWGWLKDCLGCDLGQVLRDMRVRRVRMRDERRMRWDGWEDEERWDRWEDEEPPGGIEFPRYAVGVGRGSSRED